ncbi:S-adenosyl-L-methionine-dependent methyltransferase [Metschnikowia bicuspidata var. bicuspidata NRRL YB-4993]|uniref:S-adenosyl-L-methionine-dependent methyltransferase n=1 Tax=Metschnikowia bicuspidata var. bicuspidata NRRL YB-4993 TaxID=869754 RepID=A0A1A0HIH1_9ASCO|nr:S-adenosyl-L-methionine-dependent methyltransferase [Metschnikowia bicuspidata var. bicuspidata NRRL YB-4993]OBA23677.1 S-adenosyl-L-methionine-dependent methyltransferase [Metschnikowia bicuspidata var. bicuspidata NRRL YB-4993]
MSTFSKSGFKSLNYNSFRPQYPPPFYQLLLDYTGKTRIPHAIDLGCGTGVASFPLLNFCDKVVGLDLSPLMISGANKLKQNRLQEMGITDESRINFEVAAVEEYKAPPESSDLIVAAECIHWFKDYDTFFTAAAKQLRPGATLAYWYYVDPLIVDFNGPSSLNLSKQDILINVMDAYDLMVYRDESLLGPHWEQPGRSILQGFLTEVDKHIPRELFTDIKIRKYMPGSLNTYRNDDLQLVRKDISLLDYTKYISTYSSYHNYDEATGKGEELLDNFLRKLENEFGWDRNNTTLTLEWYAGYTFMKKR